MLSQIQEALACRSAQRVGPVELEAVKNAQPRVPGSALRASTAGTELCAFGFGCLGLQ